jgi:hypothetical protein
LPDDGDEDVLAAAATDDIRRAGIRACHFTAFAEKPVKELADVSRRVFFDVRQ